MSRNVVETIKEAVGMSGTEVGRLLGVTTTEVGNMQRANYKTLPRGIVERLNALGMDGDGLAEEYKEQRAEEEARLFRVAKERLASGGVKG